MTVRIEIIKEIVLRFDEMEASLLKTIIRTALELSRHDGMSAYQLGDREEKFATEILSEMEGRVV